MTGAAAEDEVVDVRRAWLLDRVDRRVAAAIDDALRTVVEHLAVATGDAVSLRSLSRDGAELVPVAAHHPDPEVDRAMSEVMARSAPVRSGLWQPVVEHRRPARYVLDPAEPDPQASPEQQEFIRRFPITAVVGVPLLEGDEVVGGMSLVRFTDRRPFEDADEELLQACSARVVPLLLARRGPVDG